MQFAQRVARAPTERDLVIRLGEPASLKGQASARLQVPLLASARGCNTKTGVCGYRWFPFINSFSGGNRTIVEACRHVGSQERLGGHRTDQFGGSADSS